MTIDLGLRESLCGWTRLITTIDGEQINIEKTGPTPPGSSDRYRDLGMPLSKHPDRRGCMVVEYKVNYPLSFTREQKDQLNNILS